MRRPVLLLALRPDVRTDPPGLTVGFGSRYVLTIGDTHMFQPERNFADGTVDAFYGQ
jgi:hypothetical protein